MILHVVRSTGPGLSAQELRGLPRQLEVVQLRGGLSLDMQADGLRCARAEGDDQGQTGRGGLRCPLREWVVTEKKLRMKASWKTKICLRVIRLYESEAYGGKVYELSWECARVEATYDNKL